MKFEVIVALKKEVLDTEGRAIKDTLNRLGFATLRDVNVTKRFVLELDGTDAEAKARDIAREYLTNPVSQTFELRKL